MRYSDSKKGTVPTEGEYKKLLSRNEELSKQEATLKKEYTTLLRKISSLSSVLMQLEQEEKGETEKLRNISEDSLERVPDLKWYNKQISLVEEASRDQETFVIPEELSDSYKLYRDTPLLHRDVQ